MRILSDFFNALTQLIAGPVERLRRRVRGNRITSIAEARDRSLVRIRGTVLEPRGGFAQLRAPFSARACVFYLADAWEQGDTPRLLAREWKGMDFYVSDATGVARIEVSQDFSGTDARIDFSTSSGLFADPTTPEAAFLQRHRLRAQSWLGTNRSIQFREAILAVGETVTVVGEGQFEVVEDGTEALVSVGYRGSARPVRLVIGAPFGRPLLISDHDATVAREDEAQAS